MASKSDGVNPLSVLKDFREETAKSQRDWSEGTHGEEVPCEVWYCTKYASTVGIRILYGRTVGNAVQVLWQKHNHYEYLRRDVFPTLAEAKVAAVRLIEKAQRAADKKVAKLQNQWVEMTCLPVE